MKGERCGSSSVRVVSTKVVAVAEACVTVGAFVIVIISKI